MLDKEKLDQLRTEFKSALQENIRLANFATMNVGGVCDALITAHSADDLARIIFHIWSLDLPVKVLGGGSNLLISDRGIREIVVVNHAHNIRIYSDREPIQVIAESGALMINLGKQLA